MTNEEKINDAATYYGYAVAGGCIERGYIQDAFEAGAKWKDQRLKEYLENKRIQKSLGHPIEEYGMGFKDGVDYILEEIINELFGETEEVDHSNNDE